MAFPADMIVSAGRHGADFLLRPIGEDDVERDFAAVVASRADLRLSEQSGWPSDDFTVADNRDVAHESFVAQTAVLKAAGLRPAFEIREHDRPGVFIVHV